MEIIPVQVNPPSHADKIARSRRASFYALAALIILFLLLGIGRALTAQPWNDEAWYSTPSLMWIEHGHPGTPLLETHGGGFWMGIDRWTYWVPPLQIIAQVPWFDLFGFSLLTVRLFAMVWGLIALAAWYLTIRKLTSDIWTATVAVGLLACDYQFVSQTALGRMDAMSLGLASLAIATYLHLRERSLIAAILVSQACVVGCGLTHPTPGVPAFFLILFLTFYLDWRNLRWKYVAAAMIPYAIGAAVWGLYISGGGLDLFRAQFFGNVVDMDRLGGFHNPFAAILREFTVRYRGMSGFEVGMHPLYRIKLIGVIIYFGSVIAALATPALRRHSGVRLLLWMWTVMFTVMAVYDYTKEVKYGVHIVPFYDALAGIVLVWLWRQSAGSRLITVAVAAVIFGVQVGGLAYTIFIKNDYAHSYLTAANFIARTAPRNSLVMAGSEFGFALGFDRNIVDDRTFGYYSGKRPDFIVIGNGYRGEIEHARIVKPEVFAYVRKLLGNYDLVYSHTEYQIFERKGFHPKGAGA
jgi:4-amino-4-deoxy-L-arabinose transferase-like glycosyltransferase